VHLGARVLVLDDAFQCLEVRPTVRLLLVSADTFAAPRLLPAGPWRERISAAARADFIVVTRKAAGPGAAAAVLARMRAEAPRARFAKLALVHSAFIPLWGGRAVPPPRGQPVIASAGIADPASLAVQLEQAGARVERLDWPDHHRYTVRDVDRIVRAGRRAAQVVVTEKDAVKLRTLWPRSERQPLVAVLDLCWEGGEDQLIAALHDLLAARRSPSQPSRQPT
jgi:tetraacyldisaccharide 4'-kinase